MDGIAPWEVGRQSGASNKSFSCASVKVTLLFGTCSGLRSSYAVGFDVAATFSGNTQAGTPDWPASTVGASIALTAIEAVEAVSTEITVVRTERHRGSGRGKCAWISAFSTLLSMSAEA